MPSSNDYNQLRVSMLAQTMTKTFDYGVRPISYYSWHVKALRKAESPVFDMLPTPRTEDSDCLGFGLRPTKAGLVLQKQSFLPCLKKQVL